MSDRPDFIGIGVGPGDPNLLTIAGLEAIRSADVLFAPRASKMDYSVARRILEAHAVPDGKFHEIVFDMDQDRSTLETRYAELANSIGSEIEQGNQVGYLTLGDAMTYSTYIYTLDAVLARCPEINTLTIPGVTSFCAVAAATNWPLGEQKERILTLPCPDEIDLLETAIQQNDVVILMKVGKRLGRVMALLEQIGIREHCSLGRRVGMEEEHLLPSLAVDDIPDSLGYLSTILIRKKGR